VKRELELAYVGIEVPDPATLTPFFGEVIGLIPGEGAGTGTAAWRNDEKAHRVIVQPGPANDAVFLGFEAADGVVFDRVSERLAHGGWPPAESAKADTAARRVGRMAHVTAPWGIRIELVQGVENSRTPFSSAPVPGGFHTDGVGFGHAVFATTAFDESHRFLTAGLGFVQSDWLEMPIGEGMELEVRFYHCNARHHSVALARTPFDLPQRLHHLMFETNQRDDTGAAFDRAWASGLAIPNGLGRHDNDGMFSFYVASPPGFLVEVGHGARVITDGWADNRRYDRISRWGHQSLRTP
jgi:2,3-dihydroxybiphenyl 1,2-dioxygenase